MTRTVVLLSSLVAGACTVGQIPEPGTVADGRMADGGGGGADGPVGNGCVARIAAPDPAHAHLTGGTPNAGQSCIASGCHLAGALGNTGGTIAPAWQFAGTIYKPNGTTPSAGVTVTFKRVSDGLTVAAITDDAGTFHVPDGMLPSPFPATVHASACPTLTPMVAQLQTALSGGDCSAGGTCHGGTQGKVTLADR